MKISLPALLDYCTAQGIQLAPDGVDELAIDAPPGTITPNVLDGLRTHKPAVLHFLKSGEILLDAQTTTVADVRQALELFNSSRIRNSDAVELVAMHKNTPGRIRTCDLRFRKPMLYPAELRGHRLYL